jgi:hypothetical protein
MVVTAMRKSFAVLLIGSWIGFSAVELVEAGERNTQANAQLSREGSDAAGAVADDLLESPGLTPIYQPIVYAPGDLCLGLDYFAVSRNAGKIYKALRVFLI